MGVGMCAVVAKEQGAAALACLAAAGQPAWIIGTIEAAAEGVEPEVLFDAASGAKGA